MRYSGIGGQAVMEGVMMKNQEKYAVAVRKPDGEIALEVSEYKGIIKNKVTVKLLGGDLEIEYNQDENTVYMTGPARVVFTGEYDI